MSVLNDCQTRTAEMRLFQIVGWFVAGLLVLAVFATAAFLRDINRARDRVAAAGTVISSPFGDIEFTAHGSGPAVLVIHGSGGGYDQGELIAKAVLDKDFYSIIPSRFGYLRSTFHQGNTWDDQAHAYAALLDHLGIDRVAVVAMSHGGPSALLFAVLHPARVSSLTLISCGVAPSSKPDQAQADDKGSMLTTIFEHNFLYWAISKVFRRQLMGLMGASDVVIAGLAADERQLFNDFIDFMNPVSLRSVGAAFDNAARLPGDRIAAITAPTLIFHATDDTLQLFHNAEFAATTIPDARLVKFESGGHFLIGTERAVIGPALRQHILDQSGHS